MEQLSGSWLTQMLKRIINKVFFRAFSSSHCSLLWNRSDPLNALSPSINAWLTEMELYPPSCSAYTTQTDLQWSQHEWRAVNHRKAIHHQAIYKWSSPRIIFPRHVQAHGHTHTRKGTVDESTIKHRHKQKTHIFTYQMHIDIHTDHLVLAPRL